MQRREPITFLQTLHPKYIGTWGLVFLMWLIAHLPHKTQQNFGTWLGKRLYKMGGSRLKVTRANIRACFPDLSEEQQEQLIKDTFIANAKGYLECTTGWWRDMDKYYKKLTIEGQEELDAARKKGNGVLLFGGHFSILDFALPLVAHATPIAYMYRPNDNRVLDRVIEKRRAPYRHANFAKFELKELIQYLKDGNVCWYAFDQDLGKKNSVFAPFFNVSTATLKTAGWLLRESGATPMFMSQFRDNENGEYRVRFREMPPEFPFEDDQQNAALLNQFLEEEIRRDPAQYLWLHRRFKTRPEGEESIY